MIKEHLNSTISALEAEKANGISAIREKVTREQILPYNASVDESMNAAIAELKDKKNAKIAEIEEQFRTDKTAIIEAADATKKSFANTVIEKETEEYKAKYDRIIDNIKTQLSAVED